MAEASKVAFAQLALGAPAKDILIPIVSTTGTLIRQFFAVVLLEPSFPMTESQSSA